MKISKLKNLSHTPFRAAAAAVTAAAGALALATYNDAGTGRAAGGGR
jgi:hypothetical protein